MRVCLRATVSLLSCTSSKQSMVALGAGAAHVPEVPLEPGDDLLERLFGDRSRRPRRIEVGLVHAFGEQAGESPGRHYLGDIKHSLPTLLPGEVHIGLGVAVELADTSASNVVGRPRKARQLVVSAALDLSAPISGGKLLETGDSRLLKVLPQHPRCVELGVGQPVRPQHPRHSAVGVQPMPDRDRQAGEDEVAGVAHAGAGGAGLVKVAKIHGGRWMEQKRSAWALEPWAPKDESLGDSPQTHQEM